MVQALEAQRCESRASQGSGAKTGAARNRHATGTQRKKPHSMED